MKQEGLKERVELLEAGEKLGYPRLGYGRSTKIPHDKRIPQGQDGWEKFCAHAHVRRIYPALRIARVLRDNNVQRFHPLSAAELKPFVITVEDVDTSSEVVRLVPGTGTSRDEHGTVVVGFDDLLSDIAPAIVPLPRPKKGGHKKPQHPNSKRKPRV